MLRAVGPRGRNTAQSGRPASAPPRGSQARGGRRGAHAFSATPLTLTQRSITPSTMSAQTSTSAMSPMTGASNSSSALETTPTMATLEKVYEECRATNDRVKAIDGRLKIVDDRTISFIEGSKRSTQKTLQKFIFNQRISV